MSTSPENEQVEIGAHTHRQDSDLRKGLSFVSRRRALVQTAYPTRSYVLVRSGFAAQSGFEGLDRMRIRGEGRNRLMSQLCRSEVQPVPNKMLGVSSSLDQQGSEAWLGGCEYRSNKNG